MAKTNWNSTTLGADFQQGGLTFPFWQGDLLIGTGRHIGLCTLWTPRSKYCAQLDRVAVIGNLYSRFGIGVLIRNVLAVPQIAFVVVTGVDSPEVRQRQADALLHGDFEPEELFLKAEHVSEFYRRTTSASRPSSPACWIRSLRTREPPRNPWWSHYPKSTARLTQRPGAAI